MSKLLRYFATLLLFTLATYATVNCEQTQNVQSFVQRFYVTILEREPDVAGLDDWTNKLIAHERTGATLAEGFIFSDEYTSKAVSDESYVSTLYKAFFNREAELRGLAYWLVQLEQYHMSREEVLYGFTHSKEFETLAKSYGIKAYEGATLPTVVHTQNTDTNTPPQANAGADQSVVQGTEITLDGSLSQDSDGTIACYWWREGASILSTHAQYPLETNTLALGRHTLLLSVADDKGVVATDALVLEIKALDGSGDNANNGTTIENNTTQDSNTTNQDSNASTDNNTTQNTDNNTSTETNSTVDVTPPVLKLNGDATITLEQNAVYTELGATAVDAVDGNLTVSISGNVDTSTVGSYTVTYTTQDNSSNESNVTRTITIVDVTPPVITFNGEANIILELGETYEELGASAVDNSDGNVSVEISGTVDTLVEGSHTVTYTATDSSGNTTTATRTVTVEKSIEPPSIVISDELNSTLSENTIPYNRITLEIQATSTQTLTAINTTLSQEQNRTIRVKGVDNNGTFYLYNVALLKGENQIELNATNEVGEEVLQSITINADANLSIPIGMTATVYEGIQSLDTQVIVGTLLDAKEYLFDDEGDGIIDQISTDGNFTVNITEEGRYKPRVTIRTQNDLLYSNGDYALSLDVKSDENQSDPVGAEAIDVAKEFVQALINEDRLVVERLLGSSQGQLDFVYSDRQRLEFAISNYKQIVSWSQKYHTSGSATVKAHIVTDNEEMDAGFELNVINADVETGREWLIRTFY